MTEHIPKPETSTSTDLLTKTIRLEALKLGFTKIGFSQIDQIKQNSGLDSWLQQGHQGEMHWMGKTAEKRQNPNLVLEQACSIISLGMNYYVPVKHSENPMNGKISRYAWGEDYHHVLKKRLSQLANWIKETIPSCQGLFYSDTGPVMDKIWAHKAGVGWIGKHSNLISRDQGSWLFLGEILLDLPLTYDEERLDNYEIGYKYASSDGTVRANTSLYSMSWSDMQAANFDLDLAPIQFNSNIGDAVIQGIESDLSILTG